MVITKRFLLAAAAVLALAAPAAAANMIGNCEVYGEKGSIPIATPAKGGQFTVLTSLPAPIWWNGDAVETSEGWHGILHGRRNRLARRLRQDGSRQHLGWEAWSSGNQTSGYDVGFRPDLHHRRTQEGV
jgi:polar amino acid transport system substrate-binding protein